MFQTANHNIRSSVHSDRYGLWAIAALVLVGAMLTAGVLGVASHFHSGDAVALGLALLGLPVLVVAIAALCYAVNNALAFVSSSIKWWHVLWLLTFVSALVFRVRNASDISSDPLDGWAIFRIAMDMVVAFVLLGRLALRRTHWLGSMVRGALGALTVYGLVCLASTAWSVFPSWTLYKSFEYLVDIALLAAILESLDSTDEYRNLFNWTWALYALLLLSVWIGAIIWPQEALYGADLPGAVMTLRLGGVMPAMSANDVGTYAAILGLLCLARLFPISEEGFYKPWYALLLVSSLVTMVLSQTRTAMAGFVLGGFVIMVFSKRGKLGALLTFIVGPIVAVSTMGGLIWAFLARGQSEDQMANLSSRAQWWAFAWQTYLERPLTGLGAYAAGRFAVMAKMGMGGTSSMHSDYLETIVGTGIWGIIPLIAALAVTWWLLLRYIRDSSMDPQDRQLAYEGLAILALITFRSVFSDMLTWHPPLYFLAILGCVEFLRRRREAGIGSEPLHRSVREGTTWDSTASPVLDGEGIAPSAVGTNFNLRSPEAE